MANAATTTNFQAQALSPAEEERVLTMAKNQIMNDGATALQVLEHAAKLRKDKFKLAGFEMFYTSDGVPDQVGVCYWIGAKRLDEDKFCDIGYQLSQDRNTLSPAVGTATEPERRELTVMKLQGGRDSFLENVDETYNRECLGTTPGKKDC